MRTSSSSGVSNGRSVGPPNERSVRISRTTLYRTVAGTTPGREFTDEVPTKVIQPGQSEVKPKPLVGIPSPKPVAPPLRHEGSQPPRDPAIGPVKQPRHLGSPEVLSPASQIPVQSGHHRPETLARRPAGEPPYLLPKTLQRLRSDVHVEMPLPGDQPVPQEIDALGQRHQLGLPLAQPQPESREDLSCPLQRLLRPGRCATGQSHVVRIPHVARAFRIEHPLQPGQVDVRQQGTDDPTLRGPRSGSHQLVAILDQRLQEQPHQPQHAAIRDSLSHRIQQRLVRNFIEELFDVHVHDVDVATPHLAVELAQGAERATPRPKPVTVRRELRLNDRLQDLPHRLLAHPISYRRNPQRPLPPIRLGNQHPPHRLRSVGLRSELDAQRRQIRLQLLPKGFHRDAIHPGLPTIAAHRLIRGSQPPQVQHLPHETVELPPLLVWRASRRAALLAFPRRDRRLSHGNLPRLRLSTQRRVAPALPLLWTPFAPWTPAFADAHARRWPRAGRAALTTRRRYYEVPDFSLRTDRAFRHGLIAQPSPPALRPQPRHEHHHRERNEISPGQTLLCPSVPPAHTVCLNALRRYFLRLKAAGSDQRARGRPVRQALAFGYGPEVRRKPFGFHLAMDTLPSPRLATRGRRVPLGLLSTHPPCEGAAGLSPARETPRWAHSPDYS